MKFMYMHAGLMPKQYDSVKLHVTVMNSIFRREGVDSDAAKGDNRRKIRESFDAVQILKVSTSAVESSDVCKFILYPHLLLIFATEISRL